MSHPTWVRGLKHRVKTMSSEIIVAPYVGAWIETNLDDRDYCEMSVAPYVGAWIETNRDEKCVYTWKSHPTWVRGLKLSRNNPDSLAVSRTLRGCVD